MHKIHKREKTKNKGFLFVPFAPFRGYGWLNLMPLVLRIRLLILSLDTATGSGQKNETDPAHKQ